MSEEPSTPTASGDTAPDSEIVLELPDAVRPDLKDPLGPIYEDTSALLDAASDGPIVAIGDIVTYHLLDAGRKPDVAFVDERTERSPVDNGVRKTVVGDGEEWFDRRIEVANPSATVTASLLDALVTALDGDVPTIVIVYGEEDLAALPAILAVPDGASVVYGQPGEGMVHVPVDSSTRERAAELIDRMDGDSDRVRRLLTD